MKISLYKILFFLLLPICALPMACQPFGHSKIEAEQLRPDTFKISKAGTDSLRLRFDVKAEAETFCKERNLYAMPVETNYNETFYEMIFRCLPAGDPELFEPPREAGDDRRPARNFGGYRTSPY